MSEKELNEDDLKKASGAGAPKIVGQSSSGAEHYGDGAKGEAEEEEKRNRDHLGGEPLGGSLKP
jgi:hypothetical protein